MPTPTSAPGTSHLKFDKQLLKQSIPYRGGLAARNAQDNYLSHGFIVLRDLETEGAMYADVDVKQAIANGEIPGPASGNPGHDAHRNVRPAGDIHGKSACLRECNTSTVQKKPVNCREQVMFGADWIKYYSDHGYFYGPDGALHSSINFSDEEAKAISG